MKNFYERISEQTETTEAPDRRVRGWILYDGDCRSCTASARMFESVFRRRGFEFLPLETPWVVQRLGLKPNSPFEEMRVITCDGRDFGGAGAVIFLTRQIWWARPFTILARFSPVHRKLDRAYRWLAAHRGCTHINCALPRCRRWPEWIGIVLLPTLALFAQPHLAPWIFMWLMAGAIFFGCKWLTFWRAKERHPHLRATRIVAFFFLWPGMDAHNFLRNTPMNLTALSSQVARAAFGLTKVLVGIAILFGVARMAPHPILAGWAGMIGIILILHFGIFDLAEMAWRAAGIGAWPIMDAPLRSTSLNEFWGRRWNGAFNQLLLDIFFRRFARSFGVVRATLAAFLISGLIHELVISLPARAGYGLPTAYFLLQGWGAIAQRMLKIRRGFVGWFSTMLIVAGPAFWLFHPPFVKHVILPFMQAIDAL